MNLKYELRNDEDLKKRIEEIEAIKKASRSSNNDGPVYDRSPQEQPFEPVRK